MLKLQQIDSVKVHREGCLSLFFLPARSELASASDENYRDDIAAVVHIWERSTGRRRITRRDYDAEPSIAPTPDGRTLAWATEECSVKLLDLATGKEQAILDAHGREVTSHVTFSPNGSFLASSGSAGVQLWNTVSWSLAPCLTTPRAYTAAFSPDSRMLAVGRGDGHVVLWDLQSPAPQTVFHAHGDLVRVVVFSPDGRTLATASRDQTVKLWDILSGRELRALEATSFRRTESGVKRLVAEVFTLAYLPNSGLLVTGDESGALKVWDPSSGKAIAVGRKPSALTALAVSHDGRTVATGHGDGRVRFWQIDI